MKALIGGTGFVGSNLASQYPFDVQFHSRNIDEMRGGSFELVVCAGVQAKKWWANQNPDADWAQIERLLAVLATIRARRFILVSTVDIYTRPAGVTEASAPGEGNHPYGTHRLAVEEYVRATFPGALIVRLPGLFGMGLKKNVIFDLLNEHALEQINPAGRYQYYSLHRLWADLERCREAGLTCVNFATEPIATETILTGFFPELAGKVARSTPFVAQYDMRSLHGGLWQSPVPGYLLSAETVLDEMGAFIAGVRSGLS